MTWLISKALMQAYENSPCSQAQAAAYSEENCSDGKQSAPLSGESTPQAYCAPAKMKGFSRLSRFGMTFKPLTDDLGAELLTWYLAGFPARTSALPEKAQESTENARECGATWLGSLGKYDPASRSWKTAQRSFLGDLDEFLAIWPRSGMTAGGECWELPMLEPITKETDSGLWLPTPCATDAGSMNQRPMLALMARKNLWPTPLANSHTGAGHGPNKTGSPNLQTMVKLWPTPNTSGLDGGSNSRRAQVKRGDVIPAGGQLNPMWVEWLQGFPLGWTELNRLATPKSPCAQQQHGVCLGANSMTKNTNGTQGVRGQV